MPCKVKTCRTPLHSKASPQQQVCTKHLEVTSSTDCRSLCRHELHRRCEAGRSSSSSAGWEHAWLVLAWPCSA